MIVGKVCVLTTSITVDIVNICVHFTSMNAERLEFHSAIVGLWLTTTSAWPDIIKNIRNAIDRALSMNRDWIMKNLQRITGRLAMQNSSSSLGKRVRSDDGQDEVLIEREYVGNK